MIETARDASREASWPGSEWGKAGEEIEFDILTRRLKKAVGPFKASWSLARALAGRNVACQMRSKLGWRSNH